LSSFPNSKPQEEHRAKHGVEPSCEALTEAGTKIAPSTYCAAKTRAPSARTLSDAATTAVIERVHRQNCGVYGIRKVHAELSRQRHPVARCTVARLMKGAGLRGISRAKGRADNVLAHPVVRLRPRPTPQP
jgi:putative transposase